MCRIDACGVYVCACQGSKLIFMHAIDRVRWEGKQEECVTLCVPAGH